MSNQLANEPSAYLKSAAHQPVRWQPWGEAAFAQARAEDKPILLDIGAVWCHWCHVMDGESYEDPDIARLRNDEFVCIKVDRDERPDVDARYQRAVQALTGQGGWPLTAFLNPSGEVFFGGTKFPHPAACEFLLARWYDTREDWIRDVVEKTLTAMARGGIRDHVGGGFHR